MEVYPRRNPSRSARAAIGSLSELCRPTTRSMSRGSTENLIDGLEDDQELKRTVYRTV